MADEANAYGPRRTFANLDTDTPVVSLGDKRPYRREMLVCVSDEERDLMADLVGAERVRQERGYIKADRVLFWESVWGKVTIAAAVAAALGEIVLAVKALVT